ncbi:flagellar basal-body MS-ring/collar protein FliF [Clostridium sp.]|uniref:flagellar basal-body MS-ring/collar protein FliF n=1 Tax=Clostridium sp. TaxID=1506 RepID=UPI0026228360|nr:flagellar basal-body MS-ring/collar protein FliF [Clostridium sp.]
MNKLKETFNKLWIRFKAFSKGIRIAIIATMAAVLIAMVSLVFYNSSTKYKVLFSNLDPNDSQLIISQLTDKGVDMKIEEQTILVPKDSVDKLRLELAPNLSGGSQGYELLDESSSFGMTDEEFNLKKLRAQQGELEKTIKSFPQVDTVRVHITPSKDSVFVNDKEPGKAAVYLKLMPGNKLDGGQVKSIVALVAASSDNIPEESVQVIDDNMNLLTKDLESSNGIGVTSELIGTQYELKKKYEEDIQKSIVKLLEPVVGKNKVQSSVNVELDFDSKQKTETIIDPNKVIVSQQTIKEINGLSGSDTTSGSVVDNNMQNTIDENTNTTNSSREEVKTNFESSKTEVQTISAPGEVKRLTASVFIDGNLDQNIQNAIEKAVSNGIGIKSERGDSISIVGMTFDPLTKEENQNQIDLINEILAKEQKNKLIIYSIIGGLATLILLVSLIIRRKKKNDKEKQNLLDVVIDDGNLAEEEMAPTIDFDSINPKIQMENDIKKYAIEKPDQVTEIIKSWLNENER